jgi:hypothetical protein
VFSSKPVLKIFCFLGVFSIIIGGCVPPAPAEKSLNRLDPESLAEVSHDRQLEIFSTWTAGGERKRSKCL